MSAGYVGPRSGEELKLGASEIACAVADAFVAMPAASRLIRQPLLAALDRLEAATRGSALRKVRP